MIHPQAGGLTCAGRAGVGQETGQGEFSRVAMVKQLAAEMSRATAAGDLEVARVAHETIGRLLALLASGSGAEGNAAVVDLATERDCRGR